MDRKKPKDQDSEQNGRIVGVTAANGVVGESSARPKRKGQLKPSQSYSNQQQQQQHQNQNQNQNSKPGISQQQASQQQQQQQQQQQSHSQLISPFLHPRRQLQQDIPRKSLSRGPFPPLPPQQQQQQLPRRQRRIPRSFTPPKVEPRDDMKRQDVESLGISAGRGMKRSRRVAQRHKVEELEPPPPLKLPKLYLVLSRKEIQEDFMKITGHRYVGKPKKSTLVQRGLGLCTALCCPSSIRYLSEPQ